VLCRIGNRDFDLDQKMVRDALQDTTPQAGEQEDYYLQLHGHYFPIRQVIRLITGLRNDRISIIEACWVLNSLGLAVVTSKRNPNQLGYVPRTQGLDPRKS
jgi:hypothetical protein